LCEWEGSIFVIQDCRFCWQGQNPREELWAMRVDFVYSCLQALPNLKEKTRLRKKIDLLWRREVDFVYACLQNALFEKIDAMFTDQMKKKHNPTRVERIFFVLHIREKRISVLQRSRTYILAIVSKKGRFCLQLFTRELFYQWVFFSWLSKRSGREPLFTAKL
jgi:hypothetical protein